MLARRKIIVSLVNTALRSSYSVHAVSNSATTLCVEGQNPVHSPLFNRHLQHVNFCTNSPNIQIVSFEYVRDLKDDPSVLLIDVREPHELRETGVLPNSINIPLGNVENAFKTLSDDKFKLLYGRDKPDLDCPLVFSCRAGKRSMVAATTVQSLGYTNVSSYSGGWLDWEENTKQ